MCASKIAKLIAPLLNRRHVLYTTHVSCIKNTTLSKDTKKNSTYDELSAGGLNSQFIASKRLGRFRSAVQILELARVPAVPDSRTLDDDNRHIDPKIKSESDSNFSLISSNPSSSSNEQVIHDIDQILQTTNSMAPTAEYGIIYYNHILESLLCTNNRKEVVKLLKRIELLGIEPNIKTFELILFEMSRSTGLAVAVEACFSAIKERYNLIPSSSCWLARFRAWSGRQGQLRAMVILDEMMREADRRVSHDSMLFFEILSVAIRRGHWHFLYYILKYLYSFRSIRLSQLQWSQILQLRIDRVTPSSIRLVRFALSQLNPDPSSNSESLKIKFEQNLDTDDHQAHFLCDSLRKSCESKIDEDINSQDGAAQSRVVDYLHVPKKTIILDEGFYRNLLYASARIGSLISADIALHAFGRLCVIYRRSGESIPQIYVEALKRCAEQFEPVESIPSTKNFNPTLRARPVSRESDPHPELAPQAALKQLSHLVSLL